MNNRPAIEYYNTGLQHAKEKKWNDAIEVLNKAIAEDPKHVNSYNVLGKVYLQKGEIDVARKYWFIALKLDPDNVTAKQCLAAAGKGSARIRAKALLWPAAVVILLAALVITNSILFHRIGSLKAELREVTTQDAGHKPEYIREEKETSSLVPRVLAPESHQAQPDKPAEEDTTPRPSVTKPSQTTQVLTLETSSQVRKAYEQALADCRSGQYNQAIETFQQILEYPRPHQLQANAQYWLAECYYAQKMFRQALDEFQKVKKNFPKANKVFDAELKVAYTYYNLDRIGEAKQKLQQLAKDWPRPQYQSDIEVLLKKIESKQKEQKD